MVHAKRESAPGSTGRTKYSISARSRVMVFSPVLALICAACEEESEWGVARAGPNGPIPIVADGGCSDEVKTAVREHVVSATQCFSGVVDAPGLELVATSRSPRSTIAPCSDDTSGVWQRAQATAQAALADVPVPSCGLGSLTFQGGLATEAAKLVEVLAGCGAFSTLILDACGALQGYPAATLRVGGDGRVVEVKLELLPPDPVTCGDAGPVPGDAGSPGAPSADAGGAIDCITRALAGLTFPCHAGTRLCTISPYIAGPPV